MKLPWKRSTYTMLEPTDLDPTPAPTDAQRIRVAAALATVLRDANMQDVPSNGPNAETIRSVLVMSAKAWARDIESVRRAMLTHYDAEDPLVRFDQIRAAYAGRDVY